ncbi:MAG: SGNH/GDSL hydrolase family protein [Vicinamibacterales bacterium]
MIRRMLCVFALMGLSACEKFTNPDGPSSTDPVVNYTALGASDAIGYGGSSPCIPLTDCTTGTGYVQQLTQRLTRSGKTVTLFNLGIPGIVLGPDVQALGNSLGKDIFGSFLVNEVPFVLRNSTLVTVFAGGNDVNTVGSAIKAGRANGDIPAYVQAQVQAFGQNMRTLVSEVRKRTSNPRIIALNLPNMAAMPYAAGYTLDERRVMQQLAVGFSAETNKLTSDGVLVLDLMCDASFYNGSLLSADGFHPNDAGYTHLADMVQAAYTTGSAPAPRASCAQMTAY